MSRVSRDKGLRGEAEVRKVWESHGFTVRGLEGEGDHAVTIRLTHKVVPFFATLHSEVKRQETARPWAWMQQAAAEAPPGAVPVVAFRRNNSQWLALIPLDDLARLLA
jgi:hypothetical protein